MAGVEEDALHILPASLSMAERMRVATPRSMISLVMLFIAACRMVKKGDHPCNTCMYTTGHDPKGMLWRTKVAGY